MSVDDENNKNYENIMLEEKRISIDYFDFCNESIENNTVRRTYRIISTQIYKLIENDPHSNFGNIIYLHLNFGNGISERVYSYEKKLIYDSGEQVENNPFIIDGKDSNFTSVELRKEFIDFIENRKDC